MKLWSYYYRFFETEWFELGSSEEQPKNHHLVFKTLITLLSRPLSFGKTPKYNYNKNSPNVVIETQTQLKQFQFLKDELIDTFGTFNLIVLNQAVRTKLNDEKEVIDATQKFNFGIYCLSVLHFLVLWLSLPKFLKISKTSVHSSIILEFLSKAIYDHLYWKLFFKNYLKKLQPTKLCFLAFKGERYPMRTIMREVALENGMFVSLQHGFIRAERKYKFSNPSIYFVWSDYFKEQLICSGVKSRIIISGNLQYKGIKLPSPKNQLKRKIIFLPNSGNSSTSENEVRWAMNVYLSLAKFDNLSFRLYVKPHPGDSRSLVREEFGLFKKANHDFKVYWFEPDFNIDFTEYDAVITMNSTSSIEANLFGTPSIILLSKEERLLLPDLIKYDRTILVHNVFELIHKLDFIQNNIGLSSKMALENSKFFLKIVDNGDALVCRSLKFYLNG